MRCVVVFLSVVCVGCLFEGAEGHRHTHGHKGTPQEVMAQNRETLAFLRSRQDFRREDIDTVGKRIDRIAGQIGLQHDTTAQSISKRCDGITSAPSDRGVVPGPYVICASQVIHTRIRSISDYVGHPFTAAKTSVSDHLTSLQAYIDKAVWKPTEMGRKTVEAVLVTGVKLAVQEVASVVSGSGGDGGAAEVVADAGGRK